MSDLLVDDLGRPRKAEHLELVEHVFKLYKEGDPWKVIDALMVYWSKTAPEEVDAMTINVDQYRETLIDPKFGTTKGGKNMERRLTIAFPRSLMMLIRTVYKSDELAFDNKFYSEFAKRYPFFKVAQEV